MPEKPQVLEVDIKTKPQNRKDCTVAPNFVAKRGSMVVFRFPEFEDADIVFKKPAPFAAPPGLEDQGELRLKPGRHKVKDDAPLGTLTYTVKWAGGGSGNGTGEVIPV
jgi:hypothetical protein